MGVCSDLPRKLSTREELCTLLSVAIFTSTVQHAATNNGQVLNTHILTCCDVYGCCHWCCQLGDALVKATGKNIQNCPQPKCLYEEDHQEPHKESSKLDISSSLSLSLLMFFQFDWCAWVPNTPCTMRQPPPKDKDGVTMEMIMATLPDISQSCMQMAITWHLGRAQPDAVSPSLFIW